MKGLSLLYYYEMLVPEMKTILKKSPKYALAHAVAIDSRLTAKLSSPLGRKSHFPASWI